MKFNSVAEMDVFVEFEIKKRVQKILSRREGQTPLRDEKTRKDNGFVGGIFNE